MTVAPTHPARARSRSREPEIPIWRWPSALSLDAPVVAVSWQLLLARALDVSLPLSSVVLLFLPIWLIYVADRVIDGWRLPGLKSATDRHRVHSRGLPWLSVVWLAALSATVVTASVYLEVASWPVCLGVLGASLLYLVVVHLPVGNRLVEYWSIEPIFAIKELAVGGLFATGVALFPALLIEPGRSIELWPIVFLAGLCSINCLLISLWELEEAEVPGSPSGWPRRFTGGFMACFALALLVSLVLTLPVQPETGMFLGCQLGSLFGLVLLDRSRAAFPLESLRVLADVVLLTPVIALLAS